MSVCFQVLGAVKVNMGEFINCCMHKNSRMSLPFTYEWIFKLKGITFMDIKEQVRVFVTSNFYVADPATLQDGASLLDQGIIDSTGVLEVIFFIEETFGITVEDSEMLPDNLDSIERISNFVSRKKG